MNAPLAALHAGWLAGAVALPIAWVLWRRYGTAPTPRWALPVGILALVVCLVLGSGVVELPTLEDLPLERYVEDVGDALGHWAYAIVGVLAFLETGAFVGLIAPGETFVILGGVLAGEGTLSYATLFGIVWASAFLGDLASFWLGHRLGRGFLEKHGPRVKITPERLEKTEAFLARHGGKAILIGRFLGFVRAVAPFILGSSGMAAKRFIPYSILGSGLWSALFVTLGYVFWQSLDQLLAWTKQGSVAFGSLVAVGVVGYVAYRWLHEAEHREQARGWLRAAGRTRGGRIALAAARPFGPPVRFVVGRLRPGGLGLGLTTMLAVVAVGLYAFVVLESHLDGARLSSGDASALRALGGDRTGIVVDLAQVVRHLGSPLAVGIAAVLAAAFLLWRRRVVAAVTLLAGTGLSLAAVAIAQGGEDRAQPANPLTTIDGSSFPSLVAGSAVVWVAIAVALTPSVRRVPGRLGLTGLAVVLAVVVGGTPLVLRAGYLSDVLGGAGLGAAVLAACGIAGLVVDRVRQTPDP